MIVFILVRMIFEVRQLSFLPFDIFSVRLQWFYIDITDTRMQKQTISSKINVAL